MKTPAYTDLHRYPNGYVRAAATDVGKTLRRVQRELARAQAEEQAKVSPILRMNKVKT